MIEHFTAKLIAKKHLTEKVCSFRFERTDGKEISFKAGQYMILKIGEQRRLYSISSPDCDKNHFELLVEFIPNGLGSTFLNKMHVLDTADFMGPAGIFTLRTDHRDKIFLATGTGIAPIRSKICTLLSQFDGNKHDSAHSHPQVYCFWGLKTMKDSYYLNQFLDLSRTYPNFHFYLCLSRETDEKVLKNSYVKQGHVQDVMVKFFDNPEILSSEYEYYLCGGRDLVASLIEFLKEKGVKKETVYFEKF